MSKPKYAPPYVHDDPERERKNAEAFERDRKAGFPKDESGLDADDHPHGPPTNKKAPPLAVWARGRRRKKS